MNQDARPGVGYVDIVSLEEYIEKNNTLKRETIHAYEHDDTPPTRTNYK